MRPSMDGGIIEKSMQRFGIPILETGYKNGRIGGEEAGNKHHKSREPHKTKAAPSNGRATKHQSFLFFVLGGLWKKTNYSANS